MSLTEQAICDLRKQMKTAALIAAVDYLPEQMLTKQQVLGIIAHNFKGLIFTFNTNPNTSEDSPNGTTEEAQTKH